MNFRILSCALALLCVMTPTFATAQGFLPLKDGDICKDGNLAMKILKFADSAQNRVLWLNLAVMLPERACKSCSISATVKLRFLRMRPPCWMARFADIVT